MINPKCFKCDKELTKFGAILIGPPVNDALVNGEFATSHVKQHLCDSCYWQIQGYVAGARAINDQVKKPKKPKTPKYEIETIKHKADYMGERVIYWFVDKKELLKWVDNVTKASANKGTIKMPRFGGNFIDVDPDAFNKFIGWVFPDCKRVGISGYTGGRDDLIVDEILLLPNDDIETKKLRYRAHVSRADEVSDEEINGKTVVRCWWD